MNIEVEKPTVIEDGSHTGIIKDVLYRETPFRYTDLLIEFNDGIQLKCGYPTKVMVDSMLGKLLKRFGVVVAEGMSVDPDVLKGKQCSFMTMQKKSVRGTFANIIPDSVKPLSVEEQTHKEAENELSNQEQVN